MKRLSRIVPAFAMLAVTCSQSSPSDSGGTGGAGGAPAGGSGGQPANNGGTPAPANGGMGTSTGGSATPMGGAPAASGGSSPAVTGGASTAGGGAGPTATGGTATAGGANGGTTGGSPVAAGAGGGAGGVPTGPFACPALPAAPLAAKDIIQFNDNGGWCWYQDERAIVDAKAGKFVISSVASGGNRNSDQEVVIYDIATGQKKQTTLQGDLNPDDHNSPALFLRPDGGYSALWATHRDNCLNYFSTYNGTEWAKTKSYDWAQDGCPWDTNLNPPPDPPHRVTYANPWYLSAENKVYAGVRSVSTSPALLVSADAGSSWDFYGRLSSTKTIGYVAGYYKYWGNGVDRIDFVGTEAHPRDADNSLFHGYYKGGKLYDSTDKVVDDNAGDMTAQDISMFTKVFATGTMLNGVPLYRLWDHDMARYDDGTIVITGQGRTNFRDMTPETSDPDKRTIYLRWDGTTWKATYLVKSGPKLYDSEQDYTGLSAVDPDNPNVVFVSTNVDPRDDMTTTAKREIYMGVTCDGGATFKWAPLTQGSTVDNLRPIVPKWDSSHRVVFWTRGTYRTAQDYSLEVVGTLVTPTAPQ